MSDGAREPMTLVETAVRTAREGAAGDERFVAIGWATVDVDRAARGFGVTIREAEPDLLLGAHCWIAGGASDPLVILEPSTEGRLAATLARHDEGPHVAWFEGEAAGNDASPWTPGPFGLERLRPGPSHGPHRLVVARATIGR